MKCNLCAMREWKRVCVSWCGASLTKSFIFPWNPTPVKSDKEGSLLVLASLQCTVRCGVGPRASHTNIMTFVHRCDPICGQSGGGGTQHSTPPDNLQHLLCNIMRKCREGKWQINSQLSRYSALTRHSALGRMHQTQSSCLFVCSDLISNCSCCKTIHLFHNRFSQSQKRSQLGSTVGSTPV